MKKPAARPKMRAQNLDLDALKRVDGGRGTIHGYYECECGFSGIQGGGCPECQGVVSSDMYFMYIVQQMNRGYY